MRVVFAGTPAPAVPSLQALIDSHHEVVAVVTRPDAPAGRGRHLTVSDVGAVATEHGIPLLRPAKPSDPEFVAELTDLAPDVCPVVAYGALIPQHVLDIPTHGWVNLHFSLLPAWRGAAPVQHAIWHGDDITGATTFRLEAGMDTGPVFGTVVQPIRRVDTSGDLLADLAIVGAELLVRTLDAIELGQALPAAQPNDGVSFAPKIISSDAQVNWTHPAIAIDRQVRACTPQPGAWTNRGEDRIKLGPVALRPDVVGMTPGSITVAKNEILVGTATHAIALGDVRAPGKREMSAADWARGARIETGETFT